MDKILHNFFSPKNSVKDTPLSQNLQKDKEEVINIRFFYLKRDRNRHF
jgi:hypothetical protein